MEDKKQFIQHEEQIVKKIICTHPMVERIWETGGLAEIPSNSLMVRNIHVYFYGGQRKDFLNVSESMSEVNEFLSQVPLNKDFVDAIKAVRELKKHLVKTLSFENACNVRIVEKYLMDQSIVYPEGLFDSNDQSIQIDVISGKYIDVSAYDSVKFEEFISTGKLSYSSPKKEQEEKKTKKDCIVKIRARITALENAKQSFNEFTSMDDLLKEADKIYNYLTKDFVS